MPRGRRFLSIAPIIHLSAPHHHPPTTTLTASAVIEVTTNVNVALRNGELRGGTERYPSRLGVAGVVMVYYITPR